MNVEETLTRYAGQPLEKLPGDVRSQLEREPEILEQFCAQARVAALMSFKRYERPDPALEGRLIHRVGTRIRNQPSARKGFAHTVNNLPAWARMAAVVGVMLMLSLLTHKEMLRSEAYDLAAASPGDLANNGRALSDSGEPHLNPAQLNHLDPFTTLLPLEFAANTELQGFLGGRLPPSATHTNRLWQAPPISLPVLFPAP